MGVLQGSALVPVSFSIYINDVNVGFNHRIDKFTHDTTILSDGDKASMQVDVNKISLWSDRFEMPFDVDKCQVLHVRTRNIKFNYEMFGVKLRDVQCVKALGVKMAKNIKFSQHCLDAAIKANRMSDFMKGNFY